MDHLGPVVGHVGHALGLSWTILGLSWSRLEGVSCRFGFGIDCCGFSAPLLASFGKFRDPFFVYFRDEFGISFGPLPFFELTLEVSFGYK